MNGRRAGISAVNTDPEYHEEMKIPEVEGATTEDGAAALHHAVERALPKLDPTALGAVLGTVSGLAIFVSTGWLILDRGPLMGHNLQLLGQYFPVYTVSLAGSILGLGYGSLVGFVAGWRFAFLRNGAVFLYMAVVYRGAELHTLRKFLDHF